MVAISHRKCNSAMEQVLSIHLFLKSQPFSEFIDPITPEAASSTKLKPSKGYYVLLCDILPLVCGGDFISWTDEHQAFSVLLPGLQMTA